MTEEAADDGTLVQLPGGWLVPERFALQLRDLNHPETYELGVVMVGGQPHVAYMRLAGDETPITPKRLAEIDLGDVLDAAVREAAQHSTPHRRYSLEEIDEMGGDAFANIVLSSRSDALGAARAARRRQVTPELLDQVVELYKKPNGVKAIMNELECSERTARRWLARAREAGLR